VAARNPFSSSCRRTGCRCELAAFTPDISADDIVELLEQVITEGIDRGHPHCPGQGTLDTNSSASPWPDPEIRFRDRNLASTVQDDGDDLKIQADPLTGS